MAAPTVSRAWIEAREKEEANKRIVSKSRNNAMPTKEEYKLRFSRRTLHKNRQKRSHAPF
jgi:hypothetical protein